ncbi:uncharacterized protein LOC144873616 [Branchiostoma floridae x Branchiostoma japonicum]
MAEFTLVPPVEQHQAEQTTNETHIKEETGDTGWQQDGQENVLYQETYNENQEIYDYFGATQPYVIRRNDTCISWEQTTGTKRQQEMHDVNFPPPDTTSTSQVQESKGDFERHAFKHTGEKPYMCRECGYRTAKKFNFSQHIRIHTGERPYKCVQCEYSATQKQNLKQHRLYKHSRERPYKCGHCDYSTADKSTLDKHLRKHTGEKPYMCGECGFRTTRKSVLNVHARMHTGEKPYKCDQCDFSAAAKGNLDQHVATHTGERPYMCGECGYRATQKSTLSVHMRTHTGVKPYNCHLCNYSAARKSHLTIHITRRHAKKKTIYKRDKRTAYDSVPSDVKVSSPSSYHVNCSLNLYLSMVATL